MTDNWNKVADELGDDAKNAVENGQNAAEDAWNQVKESASDATESVKETVSEVPEAAQDLVAEAKDHAQDSWNAAAETVEGKVEAVQETVSGSKDKALDAWDKAVEAAATKAAAAKESVADAAAEVKSEAADSWNAVSEKVESSTEAVKEEASGIWESVKESTQDEWQKVTDEVAKPVLNEAAGWKQEVNTAADSVKADAAEVIPSWENYKETKPEPVSTAVPELVQPVVIPPTTAAYGSQAQVTPLEPAKSYTTQAPSFQPAPVVKKKGLPAWAIVLLVIGALILLCVLLGVIFFGGIVRSILQGSVPLELVLSQFLV